MAATHCKPQQQTLSVRISESLREFLEVAREFITDGRGETVSISNVTSRHCQDLVRTRGHIAGRWRRRFLQRRSNPHEREVATVGQVRRPD
jgi:hypothetical protein